MEQDTFAVVRFELSDRVSAVDLYRLVALVESCYSWHVLLDHMEIGPVAQPDSFLPDATEELLVNRLEVGSPNFVELLGLVQPLVDTAAWIGGVTGTSLSTIKIVKGVIDIRKAYWGMRKDRGEALKTELELDKARREGRVESANVSDIIKQTDLVERSRQHRDAFTPQQLDSKAEFQGYETQTAVELIPQFARISWVVVFTHDFSGVRK